MENRYKELFQKILPTIKFSYPQDGGIVYNVIYEDIIEEERSLEIIVGYDRLSEKNKITVVPRVLNETLLYDIARISNLINLSNKSVIIKNLNQELV